MRREVDLINNKCLHIHVYYESSGDGIPHGCSEIRLLRPLSHPTVQGEVVLTSGPVLPSSTVDVVIIERLWDQSCDYHNQGAILSEFRRQGIPIIFEIDDDLLSIDPEVGSSNGLTMHQKMWLRWMIRSVDGVIVSTQNLASRLSRLNTNIAVVANALDDRLFQYTRDFPLIPTENNRITFGYMGTLTHVEDLLLIMEPLRNVLARYSEQVILEIVGIGDTNLIKEFFTGLPAKIRSVPQDVVPYPKFVSWMQSQLQWDFGIAPLIDSVFASSKSDIKFLDYAVQGIPGIFSDVPAYNKTVQHLETGIIAQSSTKDWRNWLERLINNRELRLRVARQAHSYVWQERMLETMSIEWVRAIRSILERNGAKRKRSNFIQVVISSQPGSPKKLSRNEKVLFGLKLDGFGLEIGPSYCPVVSKRAGFRVEVIDHADKKTLREKYSGHNVDINNIEDVDYVWSGEPLDQLTGKKDYYDWIIASHVIEHTPDLVSFLQQCEMMLKLGGVLSLAVPDHRYCFDKFRPASTSGDVIQAYCEKRRKHTPGVVWDHFSMAVRKGDVVSWEVSHSGTYCLNHSIDEALQMFKQAQKSESYIDVHNWRFTPASFELILADIALMGFSKLIMRNIFPTVGCEFIVQLEKNYSITINTLQNETHRYSILKKVFTESLKDD